MDTDNCVAPPIPFVYCFLLAKLATSHVLQGNKNKTYRGRGKRLSVSIVFLLNTSESCIALKPSPEDSIFNLYFGHFSVIDMAQNLRSWVQIQCDQIGEFIQVIDYKISYKIGLNIWQLF